MMTLVLATFASVLSARPARITNYTLAPIPINGTTLTLRFTEPQPQSGCSLVSHDVRITNLFRISSRNWSRAAVASAPPVSSPGSTVEMTVTGLAEGTTYWSVVRTEDTCGWSTISNSALTVTSEPEPTKSATMTWTAPIKKTNNDPLDDLAGYKVHKGLTPGGPYNYVPPRDVGLVTQYVEEGLDWTTDYYVVITAYNTSYNPSTGFGESVKSDEMIK
jgi:hypothetical protein